MNEGTEMPHDYSRGSNVRAMSARHRQGAGGTTLGTVDAAKFTMESV